MMHLRTCPKPVTGLRGFRLRLRRRKGYRWYHWRCHPSQSSPPTTDMHIVSSIQNLSQNVLSNWVFPDVSSPVCVFYDLNVYLYLCCWCFCFLFVSNQTNYTLLLDCTLFFCNLFFLLFLFIEAIFFALRFLGLCSCCYMEYDSLLNSFVAQQN